MKHLLLLRHAKSDWDDPMLSDHERPLAPRGERDAPRIGEELARRRSQPERILCSTAVRARQTVERVAAAAGLGAEPEFRDDLYAASVESLLAVVRGLPDDVDSVLLVGHNFGLEELLKLLTGAEKKMPTAALADIDLDVASWQQVTARSGALAWRITPKGLDKGPG